MENVIEPDETFDFSHLSLAHPSGLQGGAYFTKLLNSGNPLCIQTGQCKLKEGFVKSDTKYYCDLMFDNNAASFIQWIEQLETRCQEMIMEKSGDWFQGSLDANDLETAFGSCIRVYKSGKFYLLRVNLKEDVKVYDERRELLTVDAVTCDSEMVSVLEIHGIKFTTRSFQIEMELKQTCLINLSETGLIDDLIIELEPESDDIKEILPITSSDATEPFILKKPNQVYLELYKEARAKAKEAKKNAIISYLEAKNIKKTHMLVDIGDEDCDFDAEIDEVSESELEFF